MTASSPLPNEQPEFILKVVMIGNQLVGKTQLLNRYTNNEFDPHPTPTIGIEVTPKNIVINGKRVSVQLWDTIGQEKFRSMTAIYYKGAVGALLVYDITNRESFEHICIQWLKELKGFTSQNIVSILIGNKSDLKDSRKVSIEEATDFAQKEGMAFMETSAKDATNVTLAFDRLFHKIFTIITKDRVQENKSAGGIIVKGKTVTSLVHILIHSMYRILSELCLPSYFFITVLAVSYIDCIFAYPLLILVPRTLLRIASGFDTVFTA